MSKFELSIESFVLTIKQCMCTYKCVYIHVREEVPMGAEEGEMSGEEIVTLEPL